MKNAQNLHSSYDIVGDIHGHADELEELLQILGYRETSGVYCHPDARKVVFLGDYIDRGPKVLQTLEIVRAMMDGGHACGILGNHEVNALRYHTSDGNGGFLRPRTEGNRRQHAATLEQLVEPDPDAWSEYLRWFAQLPLWIDFGAFRVVHASWDADAISSLSGIVEMSGETLRRYSIKGTKAYERISSVINGPEAILPEGNFFTVGDGKQRNEFRIKWWLPLAGKSCAAISFPKGSPPIKVQSPPEQVPATTPFEPDTPITFFGHYAIKNERPAPILPNLACLDYGMGKGGQLVAYRWDGETSLDPSKLFVVSQKGGAE